MKKYRCPECSVLCKSLTGLKNHLRIHKIHWELYLPAFPKEKILVEVNREESEKICYLCLWSRSKYNHSCSLLRYYGEKTPPNEDGSCPSFEPYNGGV